MHYGSGQYGMLKKAFPQSKGVQSKRTMVTRLVPTVWCGYQKVELNTVVM